MMHTVILNGSEEPPLIRQRRRDAFFAPLRRTLWISKKLIQWYRKQLVATPLSFALIIALNPVTTVEAAVAAGPVSAVPQATLADYSFETIEVVADETGFSQHGFLEKPLVIMTDIGRPERELKEKVARERAYEQERRQARLRAQQATAATVAVAVKHTSEISPENRYPYGYCTWWAKKHRPDLPNHLGNAKAWLTNARLSGFATGSVAQVGSIMVTSESRWGHVGYVEAIEGDEIIVSDMNVIGWGKVSKRHMKANSSVIRGYIYR